MDYERTAWGPAIRICRKRLNMTQSDVATALGLEDPSYVSHLERGTRFPSTRILDALCHVFGLKVSQFAQLAEEPAKALGLLESWNA